MSSYIVMSVSTRFKTIIIDCNFHLNGEFLADITLHDAWFCREPQIFNFNGVLGKHRLRPDSKIRCQEAYCWAVRVDFENSYYNFSPQVELLHAGFWLLKQIILGKTLLPLNGCAFVPPPRKRWNKPPVIPRLIFLQCSLSEHDAQRQHNFIDTYTNIQADGSVGGVACRAYRIRKSEAVACYHDKKERKIKPWPLMNVIHIFMIHWYNQPSVQFLPVLGALQ